MGVGHANPCFQGVNDDPVAPLPQDCHVSRRLGGGAESTYVFGFQRSGRSKQRASPLAKQSGARTRLHTWMPRHVCARADAGVRATDPRNPLPRRAQRKFSQPFNFPKSAVTFVRTSAPKCAPIAPTPIRPDCPTTAATQSPSRPGIRHSPRPPHGCSASAARGSHWRLSRRHFHHRVQRTGRSRN